MDSSSRGGRSVGRSLRERISPSNLSIVSSSISITSAIRSSKSSRCSARECGSRGDLSDSARSIGPKTTPPRSVSIQSFPCRSLLSSLWWSGPPNGPSTKPPSSTIDSTSGASPLTAPVTSTLSTRRLKSAQPSMASGGNTLSSPIELCSSSLSLVYRRTSG